MNDLDSTQDQNLTIGQLSFPAIDGIDQSRLSVRRGEARVKSESGDTEDQTKPVS